MKVILFCHSLVSDWNHGNAHFLRGVMRELRHRGHEIDVLEPRDGWSRSNLIALAGVQAIEDFHAAFPELRSRTYDRDALDLDRELRDADLVLVHDWIEPFLVAAIGEHHRRRGGYVLLFYDAHHRAASAPEQIEAFDLSAFDGVLTFSALIRDLYVEHGWAKHVYVWHEAADTRLFRPLDGNEKTADLVWIGNWGDGERADELHEFLLAPARSLSLSGHVHGVRYPKAAQAAVGNAGLRYEGWLPNHCAPSVFARHRATVHVPRRAYVRLLPGVPTIRVFEALACGIPLVCAPWDDREGLFRPGQDYLQARDDGEMRAHLKLLLDDAALAAQLAASGLETVHTRHTCEHRVDELLTIAQEVG